MYINIKTSFPLVQSVPERPLEVYNITRKTKGKINQCSNKQSSFATTYDSQKKN